MGNITYSCDLHCADLKHIVLSEKQIDKYVLRVSDILFNRTNIKDLVGKT